MDLELTVENIINNFNGMPGFIQHNNIQIEELDKNSLNPSGIAHGGLVFGLADTAMGVLAYLTGRKVVTVDSNINYLKPSSGKKITCTSEAIKVGKTLGVYEAKIYNEKNELTALVTGTYFFLDREIKK